MTDSGIDNLGISNRQSKNRGIFNLAIVAAATSAVLSAAPRQQAPPSTEVYLGDIQAARAARQIGEIPPLPLVNISNSPGYDNQPSFTPDGKSILFTSDRDGGDTKQTDIYRYDIASKTTTRLTHTPEKEYSPLVTPDGKTFSVIRVEADNTQRLWRFDLDGTNPRLVLENVKPVGYHAWIDATHLALFVLGGNGQPNTLQIADSATGTSEVVASNIGRTLAMVPGTKLPGAGPTLTYVNKQTTPWSVWRADPKTRELARIDDLGMDNQNVEDFAWQPLGTMPGAHPVFASGTRLIALRPFGAQAFTGGRYELLADVASARVTRITRLAFSPDGRWVALVAEPVVK